MKYRKLQIAWSVAWGVVAVMLCVLWVLCVLCVLWVRSYALRDELVLAYSKSHLVAVQSEPGRLIPFLHTGSQCEELAEDHYARYFHSVAASNDVNANVAGIFTKFGGRYASDTLEMYIPFWFLVILTVGLAALPWLPWRFSLRTLLIGTTLIAVVLGLSVCALGQQSSGNVTNSTDTVGVNRW